MIWSADWNSKSAGQAVIERMLDIVLRNVFTSLKPADYLLNLVGLEIVVVVETWGRPGIQLRVDSVGMLSVS
jgi:hypothetical protein